MKSFLAGVITCLLLTFCLAASEGYSVVWDYEIQRPEAQRAISKYVQENCRVDMFGNQVKQLSEELKKGDTGWVSLNFTCNQPAEHSANPFSGQSKQAEQSGVLTNKSGGK